MDIRLAYGKTGLQTELGDHWDVQIVEPRFAPGLPDPFQALVEALRSPIGSAPLAALVKTDEQIQPAMLVPL